MVLDDSLTTSFLITAPLSEKSMDVSFLFNEDSYDWDDNTTVAFLIGECLVMQVGLVLYYA